MAEINDLNITDASNTARFPEGQAPSTVNNGARALEGLLARWHKDINGSIASTGSANAYAMAANQTLGAYYDGLTLAFDANFANTGSATLNVDALGAKTIKYLGTALASGAVVIGQKVLVVYDGTDFQMVSPSLVQTLTTLTATTINADTTNTDTITEKTASNGVTFTDAATFSDDIVVNAQAGSAVQALTSGTTIAWAITRNVAEVTLAHNATLSNPTNQVDGSTYILRITQDGTGSRTLAYGANFLWPNNIAPVLSTGAGDVDIISFVSDGTNMYGIAALNFS